MKTLPWFRFYGEFLTDPLIRMLSFEDQRHFIAALCMKSTGVLDKSYVTVTVRRNVISSVIGLSADVSSCGISALDAANERLRALGLIDENWQPTNWDKRQFQSDHGDKTAAERMRRYRSKRNVTPVTPVVTATDTDTDTESEKIGQSDFDQFWSAYPKKVKRKTSREIWMRKHPNVTELLADLERRKSDRRWLEGFIPDPPTYLNQERWHDEIETPKERGFVC